MKNTFTELDRELANQASKRLKRLILPSELRPLRLLAIRLRRLFEYSCNGCTREKTHYESWKEYDAAREQQMIKVDRDIVRTEIKIAQICDDLKIPYYIQSDPRGCALYIGTSSDTSYNTEGVAIY